MPGISALKAVVACTSAGAALSVAALPSVLAKGSDFFRLTLRPAASEPVELCGRRAPASRVGATETVVARISLGGIALPQRTPFVIAVRRCRDGQLRTIRRLRVELPPFRRALTRRLSRLPEGEYRIEALLNGDRPAIASAVRHLVVTRSG